MRTYDTKHFRSLILILSITNERHFTKNLILTKVTHYTVAKVSIHTKVTHYCGSERMHKLAAIILVSFGHF